MNVENIRKLAERLRQPDTQDHFYMGSWLDADEVPGAEDLAIGEVIHKCGTVACIAGWAAIMAKPDLLVEDADTEAEMVAREYLGLSSTEASQLFIPYNVEFDAVTPDAAAKVLDRLAETGEVDWTASGCVLFDD